MINAMQAILSSDVDNGNAFASLENGPAREVRLRAGHSGPGPAGRSAFHWCTSTAQVRHVALTKRKNEWMAALSTMESFFAVVCYRPPETDRDNPC